MFKEWVQKILTSGMEGNNNEDERQWEIQPKPLDNSLQENLQSLKEIFDRCADITFREFKINADEPINATLIYLKEITDAKKISEYMLEPMMYEAPEIADDGQSVDNQVLHYVQNRLSTAASVETARDIGELTKGILDSKVALLIDGASTALLMAAPGGESRAIAEPDSEPVVRGSKDGFVEGLSTNIMLLRRRIRTSRLKTETLEVGDLTRTQIAVCYIQGIANDKVVKEVKTRLQRIKMDGVLSSGYIEEMIQDEPLSIFPLILTTERPDRVAACLLEGRVAIMVDNCPMSLVAPCTFTTLLQASEDYYITAEFSTFVRTLRFIGLNFSLMLPALTVAVFSFHQELIPQPLLATVAGARQELPFPIFLEILVMEITFELLREAGVRLPKTIGQAISTVGGLVIGQAAVNAGFVSPLSVIVVALTAISSFTIPNYPAGTSIRILRFSLLICSAILGIVGIMFGLMLILFNLSSLRSFGVPYLSPLAPLSSKELKDTIVRVPWWAMITRPRMVNKGTERQARNQGPHKPDQEGGDSHR
ncbi:spore germination protein KA [Desulfitobacterium sp. LBE]|uniref:spore germination protein n=1 Tax=Desulfitobacterium sp. LBE TaxID=884086 RepID=UPI0011994899|nr:spore germination protein [Desulfitobacterium sp. LBE]TWH56833.1 spore germination protein KA [Desulfitobacterium sp. LBE]